MNYSTHGSAVYAQTSVNTSSPTKLVVMLYEGAIKFLRQAVTDIEARDYARKSHSVDRAVAIIQHLQGTLDVDRGEKIAEELDRLYIYMTTRIFEASAKLDRKMFEEVINLLNTLLSGWEEIAQKEKDQNITTDLLAQQAAAGRFELHA